MPRFFFHLHDGVETPDDEGVILPGLAAARAEAIRSARHVAGEAIRARGELHLSHWVEVENDRGRQVLAVPFGECVEVHP